MSTKSRKAARRPDKEAQALVSMPLGRLEAAIAKGLEQHLRRCDECGWAGVVLEYLPMFGGLNAFGDNGVCYCPECGEDFHEAAD